MIQGYVAFEIAKLLKTIGFDIQCHAYYDDEGCRYICSKAMDFNSRKDEEMYSMPKISDVERYLNDRGIYITTSPYMIKYGKNPYLFMWMFHLSITNAEGIITYGCGGFNSREDALENGIKESLERMAKRSKREEIWQVTSKAQRYWRRS